MSRLVVNQDRIDPMELCKYIDVNVPPDVKHFPGLIGVPIHDTMSIRYSIPIVTETLSPVLVVTWTTVIVATIVSLVALVRVSLIVLLRASGAALLILLSVPLPKEWRLLTDVVPFEDRSASRPMNAHGLRIDVLPAFLHIRTGVNMC